ncbi:SAM-dependent methyltransferase [Streptomyces thinghirensis]|nr:SAM-dependent methyltransferase [Streptomyces thinghirensis]
MLLGAGLDTRAFRLDWPTGVHVFEVEDAAVLAFKKYVLDWSRLSCGRRTVVEADGTASWSEELRAAGFDPGRPTAWLCEAPRTSSGPRRWRPSSPTMTEPPPPAAHVRRRVRELRDHVLPRSSRPSWTPCRRSGLAWNWQIADPQRWWAEHGWDAAAADLYTLPYAVERLSHICR